MRKRVSPADLFDGEEYRIIRWSDLKRDPDVNREYRERRAMTARFDARRARTAGVVASERSDGQLVPLDGQHRGGSAEASGNGGERVGAHVLKGLTRQEEREWVLLFAEGRRATHSRDSHRLGVGAGRKANALVHQFAEEIGIVDDGQYFDGHLSAIGAVVKEAEKNPDALRLALGTAHAAFGHARDAYTRPVLTGLCFFYRHTNGSVDREALATKLSKLGPTSLIARGHMIGEATGQTVPAATANAVVGIYNKGRRPDKQIPPL